ncbi:MAG: SsrA-binding protein SmpB [Buchnera aphidicola (Periphyllus acericola)]|uniref:SsrA-binding protein SmpB n=1 Tax=Buchnera aphidicola TaxID=9 RepID=UPI0030D27ABB|nr:SsrA-binding protein SmpB [Buchnera aphidicola (Periphyllus acericola)]
MLKKIKHQKKIITINKKSKFNFSIKKYFTAGIVLYGWEVKSIRQGKINISHSHIIIRSNEAYLFNCNIQPLKTSNFLNSSNESTRNRKLLLLRKEINFISYEIKKYRYTVVPISLFWKRSLCKINIGLAVGKSIYDKRQDKKNKILKKELSRISKRFRI